MLIISENYKAIDWVPVVQRRNKMDPLNGMNQVNLAGHLWLRGNGKEAPPGLPTSPSLEALRDEWFQAPDLPAQRAATRKMQLQALQDVPYIPLGQSVAPTAYRSNITGVLNGQPSFWNVRRV